MVFPENRYPIFRIMRAMLTPQKPRSGKPL
jgi:hypothetical protein